jgi:predicted dehydrogenase
MEPINRRTFLKASAQAAAAATVVSKFSGPAYGVIGANEQIRIACVGINGRGNAHIGAFLGMKNKGVDLAALCDIDERVLNSRAGAVQGARGKKPDTYTDMRKLFEDKNINAVSFATTNCWHALGTVWACQAGKDVYVEKPASWSVWEGRKMVEAARKYNRMVQVGTQSRSDPRVRKAVAELHAGIIGDVYMARALCYKRRDSIGIKPDSDPPPYIHYDLWLGPAPKQPFNPNYVHYNWHWFWDFGNGDIGNQGVHEMDKAIWGFNKKELPVKVASMGGRYGYKDQGQTPNTQVATFTYADGKMLVFEVRGRFTNDERGVGVGNLFYGSTGFMADWRAELGSERKKEPGKPAPEIKDLPPVGGSGQGNHFENFIAAVRSRKVEDLNADILWGHLAAAHVHMANTAYRLGKTLTFDPKTEQFTGDYAAEANKYLKREYREPFVIPEQV